MKKIGTTNTIMLLLSAFVLICYLPYLILVTVNRESFFACFIPFMVVVAASVPAVLYIIRRDKLNTFLKVLRIIYIAGMAFYFVTFIAFSVYIGVCSIDSAGDVSEILAGDDGSGEGNVIFVFGCRTYYYTPSWQLKSRLDTTLTLMNALPDSVCIVSGGQGENEGVAEALSMLEYLKKNGIDEERIYVEPYAGNTYQNIEFSLKMIEEEKISCNRIIGVSSDFHIPRIKYLFDYYDVEADTVSAPSRDFGQFFMSIVREYMAYIKLFLVTTFDMPHIL